ncbi:Chemotaxis protein [Leptospira biflexa serovar Patoc strain 'Patoc 1 (Ames)']|uniref:Probable chemoreceptor glutamine deamidase CheD n=1 Tax=Leptospira biflexa serovar Patoc (strain Patoc 1 / ATCC 23582 / Paris) TaxID=456481 RepID=B0SQY6_LEPBP|nr:chemotaxis protein CheD [Leptospira biflexa]ABZ94039.1 Chemotaxis protein [Leptospira biflexa serovar Patoc strain 'Patoc 1 (Ames)']ABZ97687.1 Chemotaxis protein cheD [Leptospira biflexa serovar Patoc strain 'Patoc 1 (Paris)']
METPIEVIDRFLNPGEIFFGDGHYRVRTLLGSCVSIVLWHPILQLGGMCHFLLPYPSDIKLEKTHKYGIDAFQYFLNEIKKKRTKPTEYSAKIFGGSNMFLNEEREILRNDASSLIGTKNAEFAKKILQENQIKIISEDLGGNQSRKIYFSVWDGEVWVEKK